MEPGLTRGAGPQTSPASPTHPALSPPLSLGSVGLPPRRAALYTVHLVCFFVKVNTLGVILVSVFDHNSSSLVPSQSPLPLTV